MFDELLNKEVRAFIKRATDENKRWQRNVIVVDEYHTYYVEYYQERLYWVYDYNTRNISMVYAGDPSEAVRQTHYNTK